MALLGEESQSRSKPGPTLSARLRVEREVVSSTPSLALRGERCCASGALRPARMPAVFSLRRGQPGLYSGNQRAASLPVIGYIFYVFFSEDFS